METFIKNLAKGAGAILREGFRKETKTTQKSEYFWDIVTEYDLAAEKFIIEKIQKKRPHDGILTEENTNLSESKKKHFWVVDPLDGTHAFVKGLAQFSVSIAFISNKELKFGAVYDPVAQELFFAEKGRGAKLDGKKIKVSPREDLIFSMTALIMGSAKTSKRERKAFYDVVLEHGFWLSRMESTALSGGYTAAGRYDIFASKNLAPWDYAAAGLILQEAGAKVTDFEGKPYRWNSSSIVAANPVLHKKLLRELK